MNKEMIIVLFFFRKKLQLVFEAGEIIKDIANDENCSDEEKLESILFMVDACGFADKTYKRTETDYKMELCEFSGELFDPYKHKNLKVTFMTEVVDTTLMNGCILFEFGLN